MRPQPPMIETPTVPAPGPLTASASTIEPWMWGTVAALAAIAAAIVTVVLLRRRRARRPQVVNGPVPIRLNFVDEAEEPIPNGHSETETERQERQDKAQEKKEEKEKQEKKAQEARRRERWARIRTIGIPLILAFAVLWLAFDGLVAFAEDPKGMGLESPQSWFVIIAFECVAMWLAWERWARAEDNKPDVAMLTVGVWALLALTAMFQADHAAKAGLDTLGTAARVALPLILGLIVEWALHSRRTTVRDQHNENRGRLFDSSLRSTPWTYFRARYRMATRSGWTADQAVQAVQVDDAKTAILALRVHLQTEPQAPSAPNTIGMEPKEARHHHKDHRREMGRYQRQERQWTHKGERLRARAVRALEILGFAGDPSDNPAADLLRAAQAAARVEELAQLDFHGKSEAVEFMGTLITDSDLQAVGVHGRRAALEASHSSQEDTHSTPTTGTEIVGEHSHSGSPTHTPAAPEPRTETEHSHNPGTTHSGPTGAPTADSHNTVGTDWEGVGRPVGDGAEKTARATDTEAFTDPVPTTDTGTPTAENGQVWEETHNADEGEGFHMGPTWEPTIVLDGAPHNHGEDDGDDDGPQGPTGGGAPAPNPAPGHGQAGARSEMGPISSGRSYADALERVRLDMGHPAWEEAVTQREKVSALLWLHAGDRDAVRMEYKVRTGKALPTDTNRKDLKLGYVWGWHHEVTTHLAARLGRESAARYLKQAGVDTTHPMVVKALADHAEDHPEVVDFLARRS